ncbi:hypothetical protein KC967_00465 [Candidatus Saccharibacteria bacterium]|nr:hypothetical protein [Candidatus Saccharibacteria bacterium]
MTVSESKIIRDLEILFAEGQDLIKDYNLHVRQKRIKRPDELGFNQTKSFNEFAVHNWYFPGHNEWWDKLQITFKKHQLNLKRFEIKSKGYDPNEKTSSLATKFLAAVEELEKIITNQSPLKLYQILPSRDLSITYKNNLVKHGDKEHLFQEENAKIIMDYFWGKRIKGSLSSNKDSGKLLDPEVVTTATGIKIDGLKAGMEAINTAMRRKSIPLRLKSKYGMEKIYLLIEV